ncbi:MAG: hypothetical protein ACR2ID_10700 [Chthoniobacterales bacterium]
MTTRRFTLVLVWPALLLLLAGCQSGTAPSAAPPVSAAMIHPGGGQHADAGTLAAGRSLFLGRCARCHTLPALAAQSAQQWPATVAKMSKRSGLKPEQGKAVLVYILTARAQSKFRP